MKDIKKYTDVIRYGKSSTNGVLNEGDIISISEKIDGANSSFRYDIDNPMGVTCYSRNTVLDESNRLRGFYDWMLNDIVPLKNELNKNYIYYGEWNCSHKVIYKEEYKNKFYLFSIWDDDIKEYLDDSIVINEANRLGLTTVPYLYIGKYISFEHLMSFIGMSELTEIPNTGEGIVVKNVSYKDSHNRQMFVKLVSEKFAEVQKQKKPKNPNVNSKEIEMVKSVMTKARVGKIIHKLVDEGLLKEDFSIEDMGIILRNMGSKVYDDIIKEEKDMFKDYEESLIKRIVGKNLPNVIKEVLKEEGRI